MRGYGAGAPCRRGSHAARLAPRPRLRARAAAACSPRSRARARERRGALRRPTRSCIDRRRRRRRCSRAARAARRRARCRSSTAGGSSRERAALRARHLHLPGRAAPALQRRQPDARSPASSACWPGSRARASRRCCGPRAGLVPHFHGGAFAGRVSVAGLDTREQRPAAIGALAGTLLQDPETQVVMSTVRAELALALENLRPRPAAVARAVEEVALALGIGELLDRSTAELSGGELQRVALGAALVAAPAAGAARRADLAARPGRRRRADLAAAAPEPGVGHGRSLLIEHRLERCLAAADRVIALERRPDRLRRRPARVPGMGRAARARAADARRAPVREAGLAPAAAPASSRRARRCAATACCPAPARRRQAAAERRPEAARPRAGCRASRARGGRQPALEMRGVWHELRDGPAILRGVDLSCAPGETRRADGPQRRRQVDAAAPRRRAARADARAASSTRPGGAAAAEPRRLLAARARRRRGAARRRSSWSGSAALGRAPPARPLGRRAPAPGARDRARRRRAAGGARARRADARHGPRAPRSELAGWLRERAQPRGSAVIVATHDAEFAADVRRRARCCSPTAA